MILTHLGHQTWRFKEGYDNTKFEKPRLNSARDRANDKVFAKSGNTSIISFEYAKKSKVVVYS